MKSEEFYLPDEFYHLCLSNKWDYLSNRSSFLFLAKAHIKMRTVYSSIINRQKPKEKYKRPIHSKNNNKSLKKIGFVNLMRNGVYQSMTW